MHALVALSGAQRDDQFIRRLGVRTAAAIEAQGARATDLRAVLA
ncbi:MAG: hypothetical protein ACRDJY_09315 [Thermoleophilaceae bacterium]